MRILETLLVALLLTSLISLFFAPHRRARWIALLPGATVLVMIFHVLVEGSRWQMVLLYGLASLVFLLTLKPALRVLRGNRPVGLRDRKALRLLGAVVGVLLLIVASALPMLMPVFKMPAPTGSHAVGTRYISFVDPSRPERYTDDPADYREVVGQVWYPAQPAADAAPVPYWPKEQAGALSAAYSDFVSYLASFPSFFQRHFGLVKTHSYLDAPLVAMPSSFPVLVYSHGYLVGVTTSHVALMEELASHGYVIVSIGHAYETPFFLYPDGRVKAFDKNNPFFQAWMEEFVNPDHTEIYQALDETDDPHEEDALTRQILALRPAMKHSVYEWSADISSTIDELERMNAEDAMFAGRLGIDRLGVLGWSFGGAASGQVALTDRRIKAGINMDGTQYGDLIDSTLTWPFMFMYREGAGTSDTFYRRHVQNDAYIVRIKGTKHINFSDFSLYGSFFKLAGQAGAIDGERAIEIVNVYVRAFFDKHLKEMEVPLLDEPSLAYPEVEFQARSHEKMGPTLS